VIIHESQSVESMGTAAALIILSLLRSRTFHLDLTTIAAYSKSQCLQ
jgi:hypothetical protein